MQAAARDERQMRVVVLLKLNSMSTLPRDWSVGRCREEFVNQDRNILLYI